MNGHPHPTPLPNGASTTSLARSASRASRGSTLSRNQSLIKKNIELQDLKPADVLIERFVAWKAIVKQLTGYFEVRPALLCAARCSSGSGYRGH